MHTLFSEHTSVIVTMTFQYDVIFHHRYELKHSEYVVKPPGGKLSTKGILCVC